MSFSSCIDNSHARSYKSFSIDIIDIDFDLFDRYHRRGTAGAARYWFKC
jgi:hypothetical protein